MILKTETQFLCIKDLNEVECGTVSLQKNRCPVLSTKRYRDEFAEVGTQTTKHVAQSVPPLRRIHTPDPAHPGGDIMGHRFTSMGYA